MEQEFQIRFTRWLIWQEWAHIALYHLGTALDFIIFFGTFGICTSDYGAYLLFHPELEQWVSEARDRIKK